MIVNGYQRHVGHQRQGEGGGPGDQGGHLGAGDIQAGQGGHPHTLPCQPQAGVCHEEHEEWEGHHQCIDEDTPVTPMLGKHRSFRRN